MCLMPKKKPKPEPVPPTDGSPWRPSKKQLEAARAKTPIVAVQNMYVAGSGGGGPLAKMAHCEVDDPEGVLRTCA